MSIPCLLVLLLGGAPAPVAILAERGLPHYQANPAVTPRAVAAALRSGGIDSMLVTAGDLPDVLARPATRVLLNLYGSTYPAGSEDSLRAFVGRGGSLVSAGIPASHPAASVEIAGTRSWRDQGHQPLGLGLGTPTFIAEEAARLAVAPAGPFALNGVREQDAVLAPGARVHWALDPATLPAGAEALPVLAVTDGARMPAPVTAVRMPNGVRHVWAGSGLFVDPRRPRQIVLATRALALGAAWCLDRGDAFGAIEAALPLPEVLPRAAWEPAESPLPGSARVARLATVQVADLRGAARGVQQAAACLQGLLNRATPSLYLIWDEHDAFWLDWLTQRGWIGRTEVLGLDRLAATAREASRGAVLGDAASAQVAVTLAGVRDLLLCDEATATAWSLPIAEDLRGRFATRAAAEAWAIEALFDACAPATVCHWYERSAPMPLDYLVANRIFCFWMSGGLDAGDAEADPPAELAAAERLYSRLRLPGAVLGWWGQGDPPAGIGEYYGMSLASEWGLVTLGTEFSTNLSLLSALAVPPAIRAPLPPPPLEDRVYVAFSVLESGNDPWYWQRHQRTIWAKPGWGGVPVSWCLGPLSEALQSPVLRYYQDHLAPSDELFCAVSGLGYCNASGFGAARADRDRLTADYWRRTDASCRSLGLRAAQLYLGAWGEGTPAGFETTLAAARAGAPGIETWLTDLGRPEGLGYADSLAMLDGRPLIRCVTRWVPWEWSSELSLRQDEREARALADEIRRQIPAERPAFVVGLTLSWSASPEVLRLALEQLGPEYEAVTVSQLGALLRQAAPAGRR